MPVFWTWWIVERADDVRLLAERERARDDVLRHLVGDERRERDGGEREPLRRPSPSVSRAATETGSRPSADEPTRTSATPCRASRHPCSRRRWSSMQSVAQGRASSRSGRSACRRPCRCRTCRRRSASAQRRSRRAPASAFSSSAVVDLAVVRLGRRVGQVVVDRARDQLARLVLERRRGCPRGSRRARAAISSALPQQAARGSGRSPIRCVMQALSASAAARRRSVSSADSPVSSTSLSRVPCPPTSRTSLFGTARRAGEQLDDGLVGPAALGRRARRGSSTRRRTGRRSPGVARPGNRRGRGASCPSTASV